MANDTTGKIWYFDTAEDVDVLVTVEYMEYRPEAAGDDLTILDKSGSTIWDMNAIAPGDPGRTVFKQNGPLFCNGFNVSVIDGTGELWVHIR